ncbi:hypothetical protein EY643_12350 [Halioglobus maricola]|uniref:Class I SAM-dependent methyltransferase n=1 Tax=Halioglobus maricola TaxID=2601894 RepID=A0A5P9NL94_9GAMM|nr:hypothetical protein [Halioglobus maricola]QFU76389.1 hypothetical protein EY643_12350 [Halioglobus maricola]
MSAQQSAKLLPALFENIDPEQRFEVLNFGPALPETVTFFSDYRCKLHFVDPFSELPLIADPEGDISLQARVDAAMVGISPDARIDLCLFWDLFNYLEPAALRLIDARLKPQLQRGCLGHGFGVHNTRAPQQDVTFSIERTDSLRLRPRRARLPGYAPLPQSKLKEVLEGFEIRRTVLLADSRLEMLLGAR